MTAILVSVAVAPLLREPSLSSEQVSQMVLGEAASVIEQRGAMLSVSTLLDGYAGWIHSGYTHALPIGEAEAWLARAAWSEGAVLADRDGSAVRAPHRSRLVPQDDEMVSLPNGHLAEVLSGTVRPYADVVRDAREETSAEWAWNEFAATPYLWGGITASGIDCSGLVQTTYLARGTVLPRDSSDQVAHGAVIEFADRAPGDLVFFRGEDTERITHVALLVERDEIVHSTIAVGQVVRESWLDGSRASSLRQRVVAVRRVN